MLRLAPSADRFGLAVKAGADAQKRSGEARIGNQCEEILYIWVQRFSAQGFVPGLRMIILHCLDSRAHLFGMSHCDLLDHGRVLIIIFQKGRQDAFIDPVFPYGERRGIVYVVDSKNGLFFQGFDCVRFGRNILDVQRVGLQFLQGMPGKIRHSWNLSLPRMIATLIGSHS